MLGRGVTYIPIFSLAEDGWYLPSRTVEPSVQVRTCRKKKMSPYPYQLSICLLHTARPPS